MLTQTTTFPQTCTKKSLSGKKPFRTKVFQLCQKNNLAVFFLFQMVCFGATWMAIQLLTKDQCSWLGWTLLTKLQGTARLFIGTFDHAESNYGTLICISITSLNALSCAKSHLGWNTFGVGSKRTWLPPSLEDWRLHHYLGMTPHQHLATFPGLSTQDKHVSA